MGQNNYSYKFKKTIDDFTKRTIINCSFGYPNGSFDSRGFPMSYIDLGYLFGMAKGRQMFAQVHINFENVGGKYYLLFSFSKGFIKIDKLCSLHLLMDNGKVISLSPEANPVEELCRFPLCLADMDDLESSHFIKWRITNGEGVVLKSGDNVCCNDSKNRKGIKNKLSYVVFQKFIMDFRTEVRKAVPKEELEIISSERTGTSSPCFVYLMNDTTNGLGTLFWQSRTIVLSLQRIKKQRIWQTKLK